MRMAGWWRRASMAGQPAKGVPLSDARLEAHGAGFDEVVKETIFTTDMDALLKASDVRFEFYDKERPAWRSPGSQVQRLVDPGFLVEIEVIGRAALAGSMGWALA